MSADLVAVNERGRRIGEDNPNATLTDHEVELLFELRDTEGWGYRRLAKHFEISKSQVRRILKGTHRGQQPARYKAQA